MFLFLWSFFCLFGTHWLLHIDFFSLVNEHFETPKPRPWCSGGHNSNITTWPAVQLWLHHRHQGCESDEDCPRRCTTASPAWGSKHAKEPLHTQGYNGPYDTQECFVYAHLCLSALRLSSAYGCCDHAFMLKQKLGLKNKKCFCNLCPVHVISRHMKLIQKSC